MSARVQVHAADIGGCGHYRLIWAASALFYAGADVELIVPGDPGAAFNCAPDVGDALARFAGLASSSSSSAPKLKGINQLPDADVVVLQRPLTRTLLDVVKFLQAAGKAVVIEVDDDFRTIDPANVAFRTVHPKHSPERNWTYLAEACQLADMVTVTTPALAARYGAHGRVRVIPNMVPSSYLHILTDPHDTLRVGWTGTIDTHPRDLQVTRGAVARTLRRHDLTFHLVGSGRYRPRDPVTGLELVDDTGAPLELVDDRLVAALGLADGQTFAHTGGWLPLEKYPKAVAELDIGVVPLDDTAFNEAKSHLKGLEFAAVGRPFIATPTGPYRQLAAAGIGLLADRPRQWETHLTRLIRDEDYRLELGEQNRRAVAAGYVIENNLDRWADAWDASLEHAARRRKVSA